MRRGFSQRLKLTQIDALQLRASSLLSRFALSRFHIYSAIV